MPVFDADAVTKEMFEPIEIIVDGVKYSITDLPADMLEEFNENLAVGEKRKTSGEQLAALCKVEGNPFVKTDARKLALTFNYIKQQIEAQTDLFRKNVLGEGEASVG